MEEINGWLEGRLDGKRPTRSQDTIFRYFRTQPRQTSYGSVTDVAEAVNTTASTVTRAAKMLGYNGWSEFQSEYRARYLSALTAVEVRDTHGGLSDSPSSRAFTLASDHIANLQRTIDRAAVRRIAEAAAGARRIWVIAGGSYAVPARSLIHNAKIAGYDARLLDADVAEIANSMAQFSEDDALIAFSLWRPYSSTEHGVDYAHALGMHISAITDDPMSVAGQQADECIVVPSEGPGFFPSLVPSVLLAELIVAELTEIDQEHSRKSIEKAEEIWDQMLVVRRRGHYGKGEVRTESGSH